MKNKITEKRLRKYFKITSQAIKKVKNSPMDKKRIDAARDFLDMAERYYKDAKYYHEKEDWVTSFAALNYAHGWLDAGARIRLFKVNDSRLFTVDEESTN